MARRGNNRRGTNAGSRAHQAPKASDVGGGLAMCQRTATELSVIDQARLRGDLRSFMNMPIDIFAEICQHLSPLDLRNLSITSRRLRDILMSRDARSLWLSARMQYTTLPECPQDLSEPQYARFLFTSECYDCGAIATRRSCLQRTKYCLPCYQDNIITEKEIDRKFPDFPKGLLPNLRPPGSIRGREYFHKPTIEGIYAQYVLLPSVDDEESECRRSRFWIAWADRIRIMRTTGQDIRAWMQKEAHKMKHELKELSACRLASVKQRLLELGFEQADFLARDGDWPTYTLQAKELTPQEWQQLQPELEPLVERWRQNRLLLEKSRRQYRRRSDLETAFSRIRAAPQAPALRGLQSYPTIQKIWKIPSVTAAFENDTDGVSPDIWSTIVNDVEQFILDQREHILRSLLEVLRGQTSGLNEIEWSTSGSRLDAMVAMASHLSSNSSAFLCERCRSLHWYPEIIEHCSQHSPTDSFSFHDLALW